MTERHDNPYLRDAVLTATPEQLQLMLYDGCIRFALQARDAIEKTDYETSY
jgi:flagellar biosynthetic protein FliS